MALLAFAVESIGSRHLVDQVKLVFFLLGEIGYLWQIVFRSNMSEPNFLSLIFCIQLWDEKRLAKCEVAS